MNYTDTDLLLQGRAMLLQRAACDALVRRSVIHAYYGMAPASPADDSVFVMPVEYELTCASGEGGVRVSFPDDAPREEISATLLKIVAALDKGEPIDQTPPDLDDDDLAETPPPPESEN